MCLFIGGVKYTIPKIIEAKIKRESKKVNKEGLKQDIKKLRFTAK
jgi:hypothetical protein